MSDEERDLARIRAWDHYQKAKTTCGAQKQKLFGFAEKFLTLGQSLRMRMDDLTGDEMATLPMPPEYKRAINDHKAAVDDLKAAEATAKELGWGGQMD
jgi:hypothetical protein